MAKTARASLRQPIAILLALAYALAGILWIVFSDRVLEALVLDAAESALLQTAKGTGFVLLSALAIYAALTARAPAPAALPETAARAGPLEGITIGTTLMALVGIPLIAFVGTLAYDLHSELKHRVAMANESLQRIAERSADRTESFFARAEHTLRELSQRLQVQAMDPSDCDPLLGTVKRLQPAYANVLTLDAHGNLVCSAVPPPAGAAPRPDPGFYFSEVVRTRAFTVGKPARGFLTGRWVSTLAYPVLGQAGELRGVVAASVDLSTYQPLVTRRRLPEGTVIAILNSDRVLIARSADAAQRVGSVVNTEAAHAIAAQREGVLRARGYPDTDRYYAFVPIARSDWIALAGTDAATVLGPVREAAGRQIGGALALIAAVLALTIAIGGRIRRAVEGIVATLEAARRDDGAARAAPRGPRELADIARQLNRMLEERGHATQRLREGEARLRRVSSYYAALSHANRALLRLHEPGALYREVCRICVEYGHASMAYIGLAEAGRVVPAAWAGPAQEFLAGIEISLDPAPPQPRAPVAAAIRSAQPRIVQDIGNDPDTVPWRERAARIGSRASAAFPIRRGGRVIGALSLHVTETNFFEDELVTLLTELAADLSHALDNLDRETARRDAERAAAANAVRFERIFLGAPDPMSIAEQASGRLLLVNDAFCRAVGFSREELIGRSALELGLWAEPARREALVATLRAGRPVQALGTQLRRRSGELRDVVLSAEGVVFGAQPAFLFMFSDVTEAKRAEARLRAEEARLRSMAEHSPIGIYLTDARGERIYRNRTLQAITGLTTEETRGGAWLGLVHPEDRDRVREAWRALVARASPEYDVEYRILSRTRGERQVRGRAAPVFEGDRLVGFTGTLQDVTERRQMEEALRAANRRLEALSMRLLQVQEQERAAIARELHDEIGQALTAAKLQSQALARGLDAPLAARAERGIAMLDQALARTRNLTLALRPPQLDQLGLAAALRDTLNRVTEGTSIETGMVAEPERIELGRDLATAAFRVAQEAITNAVRHASPKRVAVEVRATGSELVVAVSDDGAGYDLAQARERAIRGGSMGLLGMEERVALAGGKLLVVTRPGQGTRVQATFPLEPPATV